MGAPEVASPGKARGRPPIGRLHLLLVMVGLIALGGLNFVLLKVLYTAYGDRRAFFVNQAINLLYILYGGAILYPRMLATSAVTPEMRRPKLKRHFFVMGMFDSLGTFFTCLGTPYTPGSMTPLLNQLLIPFTMSVSALYMGIRASWKEVAGAALIVAGAIVSLVPSLCAAQDTTESSTLEIRWYAVLFYALSNLPMATSACYKEAAFEENTLDVWYLTQWVSIFQFLISFLYMPLLILPGFGSQDGMSISEVSASFGDGWECYLERVPECAEVHAFWLLTGYCGVNVCFNTLGLYLTKHGSAVLSSLSFSILLPFTTVLFFSPVLGRFQEPLTRNAIFTFTGLGVASVGFVIYQCVSQSVGPSPTTSPRLASDGEDRADRIAPLLLSPGILVSPGLSDVDPKDRHGSKDRHGCQPSFQERTIGLDIAPPRRRRGVSGDS